MGKNVKSVYVEALVETYKGIYESQVRDFNALSTIHMSENDHTNVLCEILNLKILGKKPFMESFVEDVLGIKIEGMDLIAKTQIKALGKTDKTSGFIDLLLEDKGKNIYIIVENKVCGAGDGDDQLARYYFTYKRDKTALNNYYAQDSDFKDECEKYWDGDNNKADANNSVYLIYLTDYTNEDQQTDEDAKEKCPSDTSIKPDFREKLDKYYRHISYEEHIYSWLKDQVLPLMPYGKNGDAHHSVLLYIRELENMFATNDAQNKWYLENTDIQSLIINPILGQRNTNTEKYVALDNVYKELKLIAENSREESSPALNDLLSCVLCHRDNVFGKYAPEGWTVYCAANYITFYPTRWLAKYGGTKSSCIHFVISPYTRPWNENGKKELNLNIHNSACKKYIMGNGENEYMVRRRKMIAAVNSDAPNNSLVNEEGSFPDYSGMKKNFESSRHYYWHLVFDIEKIKNALNPSRDNGSSELIWDPKENVKEFFAGLVELDEIKNLVNWIDENLK